MIITNSKIFILLLIISTTLLACSGADDSAAEPTIEFDVQVVPTATPASTLTPEPTVAELKTEIIEAISPISPISPVATEEKTVVNPSIQTPPGSEEALAAAIKDLLEQTGVSSNDVTVISIEAVEWNDTSLGCPQEGFMYAQVITPGFKIVLEAQGRQYEYHTDQKANVILCQQ